MVIGLIPRLRVENILRLDPSPYLDDLWKMALVYTVPNKDFNWWRPTPEALLALGLRSSSDIPELKELEGYFDSFEMKRDLEPAFVKAQKSRSRRRGRELERRASVPCLPERGETGEQQP